MVKAKLRLVKKFEGDEGIIEGGNGRGVKGKSRVVLAKLRVAKEFEGGKGKI